MPCFDLQKHAFLPIIQESKASKKTNHKKKFKVKQNINHDAEMPGCDFYTSHPIIKLSWANQPLSLLQLMPSSAKPGDCLFLTFFPGL